VLAQRRVNTDRPRGGRLRLAGRGVVLNVYGEVVRPGLGGDHVVDVDVTPLEFARRASTLTIMR
jgi:hypothetical protein